MTKALVDEKHLNVEQREAVEHGDGPLLIIAGAGTGKTTVVTERISHLISSGRAKTQDILALTFTEKASREMVERVDIAMPYGYTQMWISTFHSFCDRILRQEAVHIGLTPAYKLLSDTDITFIMRKNLFSLGLNYFRPLGNPTKFISGLLTHFSRLQDEDVSPEEYTEWVRTLEKSNTDDSEEARIEIDKYKELAQAYESYESLKVKEGFMDFANLIGNTLKLFRTRPNVLAKYRDQFKYILIDEFQDTNIAQNELIVLLSGKQKNITAVADDDQSIYKFRGAAVSNVIAFRSNFPTAKLIVLSKNYRSTQEVLDRSYQLIQHNNPDRLEVKEQINKKLHSMRNLKGKPVSFIHADRVENEADAVAKEIARLVREDKAHDMRWKDIAILVRANSHGEPFVRAFLRHGIPFQFLGPGQLFRQPEIKELIAYLQVLSNADDSVALFRVLTMSYFDLSVRDLMAISNFAKRNTLSFFEACEAVVELKAIPSVRIPAISDTTQSKLTEIISMLLRHIELIPKETAGQLLYYFLENTGLLSRILKYESPVDEKKANNIMKFFNKLKTYEAEHEDATVQTVLDWILLSMELGESPLATDSDWAENDAVNILTVHSAKGLEFRVVFMVNLVSQRFPTTERRDQIPLPDELIKELLPEGDYHEEEERRLFYVGMTRAKDLLYMTAANFYGEGKRDKRISPFVYEAIGTDAVSGDVVVPDSQLSLLDWGKSVPEEQKKDTAPLKIDYLSYSQIESFRMCPLHYKLSNIMKIQASPTPALSFGNSIHLALRAFYEQVIAGEKGTEALLLSLLDEHWVREGYTAKPHEREMKKRGIGYLTEYFRNEFDPSVIPHALEKTFTVPIATGSRPIRIGGKIDRIDIRPDGKLEIIDYKTGKLPTKREMETSLQLSIYALAASSLKEPPFDRAPEDLVLSLYYFEVQKKVTAFRTAGDLEAAKETILTVREEIEKSDFRCSGHMLCSACEYRMFCGTQTP